MYFRCSEHTGNANTATFSSTLTSTSTSTSEPRHSFDRTVLQWGIKWRASCARPSWSSSSSNDSSPSTCSNERTRCLSLEWRDGLVQRRFSACKNADAAADAGLARLHEKTWLSRSAAARRSQRPRTFFLHHFYLLRFHSRMDGP